MTKHRKPDGIDLAAAAAIVTALTACSLAGFWLITVIAGFGPLTLAARIVASVALGYTTGRYLQAPSLARLSAMVLALFVAVAVFVGVAGTAAAHDGVEPTDQILAELRFCESSDNYRSVHLDVDGQYVYGAYQFKRATWRDTINKMGAGWGPWLDVLPNDAPEQVQDAAARDLWRRDPHAWATCHAIAIDRAAPPAAPIPSFTGTLRIAR